MEIRRCAKEKIKLENDELYANTDMYRIEDLRRYDTLGARWDYQGDVSYKIKVPGYSESDSYSGTGTVRVADRYKNIDGHDCTVVTASAGDDDLSISWYTDDNGTHAIGWNRNSNTADFDMDMESTLVAPSFLRLGEQYEDSGAVTGQFSSSDFGVTGNITGTINTLTKLHGHEEVTVPFGQQTYLAAKVEVNLVLNGVMDAWIDGIGSVDNIKVSGMIKQTYWAVPGLGAIKVITECTTKLSIPREGIALITVIENDELTGYSD